jgi:hypothetical protein
MVVLNNPHTTGYINGSGATSHALKVCVAAMRREMINRRVPGTIPTSHSLWRVRSLPP